MMHEKNNIGLGTAAIGRPQYINIKQDAIGLPFSLEKFKEKGKLMLENAYKAGVRHFDTSPGYGIAESLLIDWVKEKHDSSISVSTKWGYTYMANFNPKATQHELKDHSLKTLSSQWAVSKELLPYLKIYQIHSATLESGVLDNDEVLEQLHCIKETYQLKIGLSTTGANQVEVLKKAMDITIQGEQLFESFQFTFNILEQSILKLKDALAPLHNQLILKEVLANGRLLPNENYHGYSNLYSFVTFLAKKYGVGVDAVAMRFAMDSFPNALVLSGVNNSEHLAANLKANQFKLSVPEMDQLSAFAIESPEYWNERKQLQWN